MSEGVIGNGLFALTAATIAVACQYRQFRRQVKKSSEEVTANAKKRVIEPLIAYRCILIGDRRNNP